MFFIGDRLLRSKTKKQFIFNIGESFEIIFLAIFQLDFKGHLIDFERIEQTSFYIKVSKLFFFILGSLI